MSDADSRGSEGDGGAPTGWWRRLVSFWAAQRVSRGPSSERRWVVLDVEASGLDPRRDRLIAIAGIGVRFDGPRPWIDCDDSFEVVLQGGDEAEPDRENILIHGVGLGAQRRGVPAPQALQAFEQWAGDAPRAGFHVDFDRVLLQRAAATAGVLTRSSRWLDLEPLAAVTHPSVRARALDEWLEHFGITCLARHEAVADTLATAELLLRLWPALQREGVRDAGSALRLARNRRWAPG